MKTPLLSLLLALSACLPAPMLAMQLPWNKDTPYNNSLCDQEEENNDDLLPPLEDDESGDLRIIEKFECLERYRVMFGEWLEYCYPEEHASKLRKELQQAFTTAFLRGLDKTERDHAGLITHAQGLTSYTKLKEKIMCENHDNIPFLSRALEKYDIQPNEEDANLEAEAIHLIWCEGEKVFSSSNSHVAIGNASGHLQIADLATGQREDFQIKGGVRYLALSPTNSNVLAVVDNDGRLKTIDIFTGLAMINFEEAPTGEIDLDDFATANWDKARCPEGGVVFSQDGQYLISELKQPLHESLETDDSPARNRRYKAPLWGIWHAQTGEFIGSYNDALFDPNGNVLLDGSWLNHITIPDDNGRKEKASFYAISARNKKLAVMTHKNVHLYDLENGTVILQNKLPYREDGSNSGYYTAISFSADGKYLAAATSGQINVWEVASSNAVTTQSLRHEDLFGEESVKTEKSYQALQYYNRYRDLPSDFDAPKYAQAYNLTFSPDNNQLWFALKEKNGIHAIDLNIQD